MEQISPKSSGGTRLALMVALTALIFATPILDRLGSGPAEVSAERIYVGPEEPASKPIPDLSAPILVGGSSGELPPTQPVVVADVAAVPSATAAAAVIPDTEVGDATATAKAVANEATFCVDPTQETPASPELQTAADAWYADSFESPRPEWQPLAGDWSLNDGTFVQSKADGYDLILELALAVPPATRIEVDMTAMSDGLGGGIMIGQPTPKARAGATVIDFTAGGSFVRWGTYDVATGVYDYVGGVSMPTDFDVRIPHRLAVELSEQRTAVFIDDAPVGAFAAVEPGGVGLVTSVSSVAFDNFVITEQAGAEQ